MMILMMLMMMMVNGWKALGQSPDDPDHHCNDWMKIIVMMRLIMTMILMMLMMMMVNGWKSPWSVTRRPWSTL